MSQHPIVPTRAPRPLAARALTLILPLTVLAGCARSLSFGPTGEITDPAILMARLDAQARERRTLQSEAKVRIRSPEQTGSADALIAAKWPDELRIGLLNFFGKPVADMLSTKDHFQLHDIERRAVYLGAPTADNLARLLAVPIAPADAVQFLLGLSPRIEATKAALSIDHQRRAYRLELTNSAQNERQTIFADTETLRIVRVERRGSGHGYDLDFEDFQRVDAIDLPFRLRFSALDGQGQTRGIDLTVQQREVRLNAPTPPRTFERRLPPGARPVDLDMTAPPRLELPAAPAPAQTQDNAAPAP